MGDQTLAVLSVEIRPNHTSTTHSLTLSPRSLSSNTSPARSKHPSPPSKSGNRSNRSTDTIYGGGRDNYIRTWEGKSTQEHPSSNPFADDRNLKLFEKRRSFLSSGLSKRAKHYYQPQPYKQYVTDPTPTTAASAAEALGLRKPATSPISSRQKLSRMGSSSSNGNFSGRAQPAPHAPSLYSTILTHVNKESPNSASEEAFGGDALGHRYPPKTKDPHSYVQNEFRQRLQKLYSTNSIPIHNKNNFKQEVDLTALGIKLCIDKPQAEYILLTGNSTSTSTSNNNSSSSSSSSGLQKDTPPPTTLGTPRSSPSLSSRIAPLSERKQHASPMNQTPPKQHRSGSSSAIVSRSTNTADKHAQHSIPPPDGISSEAVIRREPAAGTYMIDSGPYPEPFLNYLFLKMDLKQRQRLHSRGGTSNAKHQL